MQEIFQNILGEILLPILWYYVVVADRKRLSHISITHATTLQNYLRWEKLICTHYTKPIECTTYEPCFKIATECR